MNTAAVPTKRTADLFTGKTGGIKKAKAMNEIATFKNHKVLIVTNEALALHFPDFLPSYAEQQAKKANNPTHFSVYDAKNGMLLMTGAPEPIWERSIKCTMPDGRVFCTRNHMQFFGGTSFPFSDIMPKWMGEEGATYELVDQDAPWEKGSFDRVDGFAPGTMLVVEDCKYNGQRVLMASERQFTLAQIETHLHWLCNPYWTADEWTKLPGFTLFPWDQWCYFDAHKGMRVRVASGKTSSVWIYITA